MKKKIKKIFQSLQHLLSSLGYFYEAYFAIITP